MLWVIKVRRNSWETTYRYCDPELPDEYGQQPAEQPETDERRAWRRLAEQPARSEQLTLGGFTVPGEHDERGWHDLAEQRAAAEGIN